MNKGNEWKKENILKFATWIVQDIAHKEQQQDDILAKKGISETKKKLQGTRETRNFLQFYCCVKHEV
jgi:RAB protein geranylgeranyltransferase component A